MPKIVQILATLVLAVLVFGAAKYLDQNPRPAAKEDSRAAAAAESVDYKTEVETTVPMEAEETLAEETVASKETATAVSKEIAASKEIVVSSENAASKENAVSKDTAAQKDRFVLTFAGDCTLGCDESLYYAEMGFMKTINGDFGYPFRNVVSYFENDDMTFVNLDGVLTDGRYMAETMNSFRGPREFVNILAENSVEFASLSNDRSRDYGELGYRDTKDTLTEAGVHYVERDASKMITLENGLKIGVYGTVFYSIDLADMAEEIRMLKEQGADLVVVSAHWGAPDNSNVTAFQTEMGHAAIDAGADIVWGTHPHVLQPVEEYHGGIIYYSLGNLSYGGSTSPKDYDSAIICQEIIRDEQGDVCLGECTIVPVSISSVANSNNYQPVPYAPGTEEYDRVLRKLGKTTTGF